MKTIFKIASAVAMEIVGASCGDNQEPAEAVSDVPIDGLSADDLARFVDGETLFDQPVRPADGLGPLYIRTACNACHDAGARGPGLVRKMSIVDADGVTPAVDQSALAYGHTIREGIVAGATTPIEAPAGVPNVKITIRMGPPILGRGYLEAISDAEIRRVATEEQARTDGIHGKLNTVVFHSVPNPDTTFGHYLQYATYMGRFGLKSRQPAIDEFVADTLESELGMTTPMRATELPNPDGLTDDLLPGVDLDQEHIDLIAFYVRRVAIPARVGLTDAGSAKFAGARCDACHVPSLHTRPDYPIAQLADIDAPVFTDMLLHDMGPALADGLADETATSAGWRTAPLIGLRFARVFLHDGRAASVEEAILAHDGEAKPAADAYRALSPADQQTLLHYVEAL